MSVKVITAEYILKVDEIFIFFLENKYKSCENNK